MDNQSQSTNDEQELAKVLAGVTAAADGEMPATQAAGDGSQGQDGAINTLSIDDSIDPSTTMPDGGSPSPAQPEPVFDLPPIDIPTTAPEPTNDFPTPPTPEPASQPESLNNGVGGDLAGVKQNAIMELKPLVDKLNIPAEEKFDTYLLLIRSTDDKSLIAPAYEAAKQIADETKRAEALFDIIKEIDFLSAGEANA